MCPGKDVCCLFVLGSIIGSLPLNIGVPGAAMWIDTVYFCSVIFTSLFYFPAKYACLIIALAGISLRFSFACFVFIDIR